MREAVAWGYLRENPAQNIKPPKGSEGRALHCLTLEDSCALVTSALSDPEDLVFVFALLTGLRPEEYLGIRRRDIGFEGGRGVARVRQVAIQRLGGRRARDAPLSG